MKVNFLGLQVDGNRQHHQDWAIEIIPETDFEKSFFTALFRSDSYLKKGARQMQPIAALLYHQKNDCMSIMVDAENFCELALVKAEKQITELELEMEGKP